MNTQEDHLKAVKAVMDKIVQEHKAYHNSRLREQILNSVDRLEQQAEDSINNSYTRYNEEVSRVEGKRSVRPIFVTETALKSAKNMLDSSIKHTTMLIEDSVTNMLANLH